MLKVYFNESFVLSKTVQLADDHEDYIYRCFAWEIDCEAVKGYYSGPL